MKYGESRGGDAISWIDGEWYEDGQPAVVKATDHALWLGSAVLMALGPWQAQFPTWRHIAHAPFALPV